MKADDYLPLVVAWRDGKPVRLGEVAAAREGVQNEEDGELAQRRARIIVAVFTASLTPIPSTWSTRSTRNSPPIAASCRQAVSLDITNDRSVSILQIGVRCRIHPRARGNPRDPGDLRVPEIGARHVIPALALPVSLIATFAAMAGLGYSIDNLSLLAITLSTGFVVDDAIVMLENIVRHVEAGLKPFAAAIRGRARSASPSCRLTLSLVAVFIPVLFMGARGRAPLPRIRG